VKRPADWRSFLVLAVSAVVLFLWLGTRGLNEPDEGRFAAIGREMAFQESWLIPHLNGIPHFQKPPLFYWAMACSIRGLGANEWAVRLPSALAAFGTIACTMLIAGILFGTAARWKSGLVLLSSALFLILGRLVTTDMLLTFWITASIAGLVVYARRRRGLGLVAFYLCMGLAFLTKGPLGFFIPASAAVAWQISLRRAAGVKLRLYWLFGFPVALAIGLAWFLAICRQHPELFDYFIRYEFAQRIASNVHGRHEPFWFFVPVLLGGFLPWTVFLPAVALALRGRGILAKPIAWFFIGWLVIPFGVLSCVNSKLATYVLPLLPPLSLVVSGLWAEGLGTAPWRRSARTAAVVLMLLVVAFPVGALVANARQGYQIALGIPAGIVLALALGLLVAAFRMAGSGRASPRVLPLLAGGFLLLVLTVVSQADNILQSGKATMRDVGRRILQERSGPDVPVFIHGRAHGVEFYTGHVVARNREASDVVLPLDAGQAARIITDPTAFVRSLAGGEAYIVIKEKRARRDPAYAGWHILMHAGSSVLLSPCRHVPLCPAAIPPPSSTPVPPPDEP
jgi:4-amino-4-deoxy-L-arabinose transferase-like glycosyltransferase